MDRGRLDAIAERYSVELILQHGSTIHGRTHAHSDLDVAILLGTPPAAGDRFFELVGELQAQIPGREVDVARLDGADPLLLKKVRSRARCSTPSRSPMRSPRSAGLGTYFT
jgi:predicted nucleotidyltransferase